MKKPTLAIFTAITAFAVTACGDSLTGEAKKAAAQIADEVKKTATQVADETKKTAHQKIEDTKNATIEQLKQARGESGKEKARDKESRGDKSPPNDKERKEMTD